MRKLLVILFSSLYFLCTAQIDHDQAHRRYWYYRTRLINDFMKIGTAQGDCILLAERNITGAGSKVGPDQIDIINHYIMTLALEYKLLSRNFQDVSETVYELYCLLHTINRLDLEADLFWDATPPSSDNLTPSGNLNGFILREDMPRNYLKCNLDHFNYELKLTGSGPSSYCQSTNSQYSSYKSFTGLNYTDNLYGNKFLDYVDYQTSDKKGGLNFPQDKYHSLLNALMYIVKYIPGGVGYSNNGTQYFQDGEWEIKQEAKRIADRAYTYLHGHNSDWSLKNRNSANFDQGTISVGANAWLYAYPFSRMSCNVHKGFPFDETDLSCINQNYYDATALNAKGIYNIFALTPATTEDNAVFSIWDDAGSNISVVSAGTAIIPIYATMKTNTLPWHLEWAELSRKVLHQNGALLEPMSIFENVISQAPCKGPYNFSTANACITGGYEWSSQERLEHPKYLNAGCGGLNLDFPGNYPGVDYMLLHNLYYEYQNQLHEGNNGNSTNWLNTITGNFVTVIYNAGNAVGNSVSSLLCSVANSFVNGITGGGIDCSSSSGSGNGGSISTTPTTSYLGYNLMDNKDQNIWPRKLGINSSAIQGTNNFPGKVSMYQNLVSSAHIFASMSPAAPNNNIPSNVIYRAGKEITLTDGFTVDAGSTFNAYIQRYLCSSNGDPLNMRLAGDSLHSNDTTNINSDDYLKDWYNSIPIHYVQNPLSDSDLNPVISDSLEGSGRIATSNDLKSLEEKQIKSQQNSNFKTGINDYFSERFLILPNPTIGDFKIYANKIAANEEFTINIYDMKGMEVAHFNNLKERVDLDIDLTQSSRGIYLVTISSNLGYKNSKKISVN